MQSASESKYCQKHPLRQALGQCLKCKQFVCDLCVPNGKKHLICVDCKPPAKRIKSAIVIALVAAFGTYVYFAMMKGTNQSLSKHLSFESQSSSEDILTEKNVIDKVSAKLFPKNDSLGEVSCDRVNVLKQCNDLILSGKSRSCLVLSDEFFKKCGNYDELHTYRNIAARHLSEWNTALESANQLIEAYRDNANPHWVRGSTYEEKGDFRLAVEDFEQSLALMPAAIQPPFQLANLYQRLGEPCSGISPLEQYSYYHPDQSENANRILKKLYSDPKCSTMRGNGKAKIHISQEGRSITSKAVINGVHSGKFIIDTGASLMALSSNFAKKIGIDYHKWPVRMMGTANGAANGYFGYLDHVAIQGVEARHIQTVVLNELADVDGLLGLSFLSRFKIEMDAEQGYISLNQRN